MPEEKKASYTIEEVVVHADTRQRKDGTIAIIKPEKRYYEIKEGRKTVMVEATRKRAEERIAKDLGEIDPPPRKRPGDA